MVDRFWLVMQLRCSAITFGVMVLQQIHLLSCFRLLSPLDHPEGIHFFFPLSVLESRFTFSAMSFFPLLFVLFSLLLSSHCTSIIFPQKPFQGSFVKAAQYMNFTWVPHSLLSILPLTAAGSLFPYRPIHSNTQSTQPSMTPQVHDSPIQTLTIQLLDEN